VITVTSSVHAVIEPKHLKPGAVVLDVARPRDVSRLVEDQRDDVLVIEGGMVEVPGNVNFNFDFGFPPGKSGLRASRRW
jgi:predicted amino acid dehydrogenase